MRAWSFSLSLLVLVACKKGTEEAPAPVATASASASNSTAARAPTAPVQSATDKKDADAKCTPEDIRLARALFRGLASAPDTDETVVTQRVARSLGKPVAAIDAAYINVNAHCFGELTK